MSFIQDKALLIIGVLLVLIVIEGLIIYVQHKNRAKGRKKSKGGSSGSTSKEKYEKVCKERDKLRSEAHQFKTNHDKIKSEYNSLYSLYLQEKEKYGKVCLDFSLQGNALNKLKKENEELEQKVRELTCRNGKQEELDGNEPAPDASETSPTIIPASSVPNSELTIVPEDNASVQTSKVPVQEVASAEVPQESDSTKEDTKVNTSKETANEDLKDEQKSEVPKGGPKVEPQKEKIMYASFPRSAGSSNYFSDLSENLADDSFFELRISTASGKATFKPLDFMKIRNYDPAMSAMLTEGVKPNVASAVVGIEPGKAHVEGKDWIIDKLAKIKLA